MFGRAIDNWSKKRQAKEIGGYLDILRGMDGGEIGMVVATATHMRHNLATLKGYDLLDPILLMGTTPQAVLELSKLTTEFQKTGERSDAAAMMVWVHTLRAVARTELRTKGREMWGHLKRGFPHVPESAEFIETVTGKTLRLDGFDQFPAGLTPEVM